MKRRRISPSPPRFRTRPRRVRGSRSSENHFVPEACRGEQVDHPKTAEYAFFQQLKEGGLHRFHSHLSHVERNQPEKFESHEDCRESYDVIHGSDKGCRLSMLIENVIAPKFSSPDSPVDTSLKKSAGDMKRALTASPNIFVKQKTIEECHSALDIRGAHGTSDVFSRKRENLLRRLRCTMFPEIEEPSLKGCNFVSLLLNRLSGRSDEDSIYETPATDQSRIADTNQKSFNFDSDIYTEEFCQKPKKEPVKVEVRPLWGCSSSTWLGRSGVRVLSDYDSPSTHGPVPWLELEKLGHTSPGSGRDIIPYAKSDSALDFPTEEGSTVSFSYLRNMEDFPHSNSDVPFLRGKAHTPRLHWNLERGERDSLVNYPREYVFNGHCRSFDHLQQSIVEGLGTSGLPTLPLHDQSNSGAHFNVGINEGLAHEYVINDHSRSLYFLDSDHNWSIDEGLGTCRLPALPLDDGSSTRTHFNMGVDEDLAALFSHEPVTVSCFPSRFHLPEDWIHVHSSEVLSYQRPSDEIFTEQQHHQSGTNDPTPHSVLGYDSGWKLLLPWDSSGETKLLHNQALQFPQEEKFISSIFLGKDDWDVSMKGSFRSDSSGSSNQSIDCRCDKYCKSLSLSLSLSLCTVHTRTRTAYGSETTTTKQRGRISRQPLWREGGICGSSRKLLTSPIAAIFPAALPPQCPIPASALPPEVEVNIHQNGKATNVDTQLPGCLGVMANLFDIGAGLAGNKLLTDRPHHDGSPIARSLSDVATMMDPFNRDQIEDKKTMSNLQRSSSNRNSNITPIKMLIAQEMLKETDLKQSPPNLVAKLMGLDALPIQLPKSTTQRSHSKSYSQQSRDLSHSVRRARHSHYGRSFSDDQIQHRSHEYQEHSSHKDVYDMWQQSRKGSSKKEKSPGNGRSSDSVNEKKMALIREKFMEAKRLVPDEKLRQSKEFQDAVEVLSSNRDLFLKFLQEPNSLFSKHMHEYHSIPSPPETKRITILKPSKTVDNSKFSTLGKKSEYLTEKPSQVAEGMGWDQSISGYSSPYACWEVDDYTTPPTRIVLLKSGHVKNHDIKSVVPPPSSSPGMLHGDNFFEEDEDNEVEETREVAKEITRQIRENLTGHMRDETLTSSVFSNGSVGDDSPFDRLENEYLDGNLSDSGVASPTSRHSWDLTNRIDSPYSTSSFSRASYSPESSVCKEAKKRLSERWALVASNQNSLEQRHARKNSSTLGEMLALTDSKKSATLRENGNSSKDQESAGASTSLTNSVNKEEARVDSPKNLSRSRSVPESSTVYDDRLIVPVSEPNTIRSEEPKKKATEKSSPKWRISSLFFSRSRKLSKDKTGQSKDECRSIVAETAQSSEYPHEKVGSSTPNVAARILNENHEQPSPNSVLDQSFEGDEKMITEGSGKQASSRMLQSNLIDKSPPIGSLVRTLSWDDPYTENTSPYSLKTRTLGPAEEEEDEQDWLVFVSNLLSASGLEGDDPSDSSILNRYLPESPLDPSLRDKFVAVDDQGHLPEAKWRQRRSNRKLAFDCVNAVIIEMMGRGSQDGPITADRVWARMKWWFVKEVAEEECGGGRDSLVVETVVRNEVAERWWMENLTLEVDKLRLEIEGKLIQELVDEAVGELSGTA